MSPEQAGGDRDYDGRSDLYSLACVLYEALAGVPAFVGATPAQVVSQRLLHAPRPVRVYRPSVSPELEAVLEKALARTPADRFQTAKAFADALSSAPFEATGAHMAARSRRRIAIGSSILALVVTGAIILARSDVVSRLVGSSAQLDSTRVAILPFEGPVHGDVTAEDLLFEAMRRWKGLSVVANFEIGDAVRRRGSPNTSDAARAIARELGAGRFVRGRVVRSGDRVRLAASLFDTKTDAPLYEASITMPSESAFVLSPYVALGDSLALRGARTQLIESVAPTSRNLPAFQSVLRGMTALSEWNLPVAESLFAKALEYDPTSARAAFWTAQIRAWRSLPPDRWQRLATSVARDGPDLNDEERQLAAGLAALASDDFAGACRIYRTFTASNPRSFAAWYGIGECISRDRIVVPDSQAPSGWRYRSSYQQAIDAYLRAFELLPSAYQSYQGGAYGKLLNLLYANGRNRRPGRSAGSPPKQFLGTLILSGDSLAFVADPFERQAAGQSAADPVAAAKGLERARQNFYRATRTWATAFPLSAGAKEGLGLSLELQASSAAIDTLALAGRLTNDAVERLFLVAEEIWLKVKFGTPDRLDLLEAARHSADSVMRNASAAGQDSWEVMSRIAALTGHCAATAAFAGKAAKTLDSRAQEFAGAIFPDTHTRAALTALGCPFPDSTPTLDQLTARAALDRLPERVRPALEVQLFGQEIRASDRLDTTWARRLAPARDYLIEARLAMAEGKPDSARLKLSAIWNRRLHKLRGDVSPDAVVAESRILLELHDTTAARDLLDGVLRDARYWGPMGRGEADNVMQIASAVHAIALRAEIATNPNDAKRWARAVLALWDGADREFQPLIQRMQRIAGR
jgi:serine/threonine-protein kinase